LIAALLLISDESKQYRIEYVPPLYPRSIDRWRCL